MSQKDSEIKLVETNNSTRHDNAPKDAVSAYINRKKNNTQRTKPAHNRQDLTGNRYGYLVVTDMIYGGKKDGKKIRTKCKCTCDCGNEIIVVADQLKGGKTKSCGCKTIELRRVHRRKDITGQKFNRLTVTEMIWGNRTEGTRTMCRCVCDCGSETIVEASALKSGGTKSCGCYTKEKTSKVRTKDWTGIKTPFGVEFVSQAYQKNKRWLWNCICPSCGEIFVTMPSRAMSGNTRSCGCETKSRNEIYIGNILKEYDISFKEQYSFSDCKYESKLRFDFAIFSDKSDLQFLLEYDGEQHYKPIEYFGGAEGFKLRKKRDQIKNEYCKQNGIDLLRIPYFLSTEEVKNVIIDKLEQVFKIRRDCNGLCGNAQTSATPLPTTM